MTASLLLLACLSADPGRITVTVLPDLTVRSRLFTIDLKREWSELTPYAARMKKWRAEIAEVADVKILDPLTPGGDFPRPAVRVNRGKWEPVEHLERWDRGGGVAYVRWMLDPWIAEKRYAERWAEYEERVKERMEANRRIDLAWRESHARVFAELGDRSSNVVLDPRSGCWCRLVPLYPAFVPRPEAEPAFDPFDPYPALEAPKPHPWRGLVPDLKPVEAEKP